MSNGNTPKVSGPHNSTQCLKKSTKKISKKQNIFVGIGDQAIQEQKQQQEQVFGEQDYQDQEKTNKVKKNLR